MFFKWPLRVHLHDMSAPEKQKRKETVNAGLIELIPMMMHISITKQSYMCKHLVCSKKTTIKISWKDFFRNSPKFLHYISEITNKNNSAVTQ